MKQKKHPASIVAKIIPLFSLLCLCATAPASGRESSWPDEPQRGANVGPWLKSSELAPLASWGTKIVRLQLVGTLYKPVPADGGGWTFSDAGWAAIDRFLAAAKANNLKVIIDYHEKKYIFPDTKYSTWSQEPGAPGVANKEKLAGLWRSIATRYKDERDVIIAYEILNEPHPSANRDKPNGQPPLDGADAWNTILVEVVTAIREIDRYHNIVVEPVGYANQSWLPRLVYFDPGKFPGIIYSVHIYQPHEFAEQGSKIATEWLYGFDNKSGYYYPGMFGRVTGRTPITYTPMLLDRAYLEDIMKPTREFQRKHKEARVFVGEFGAKRWSPVNLDGRDSAWAYLGDCMRFFNSADIPGVKHPHWDWAIHAYRMAANDSYTGLEYSNERNDNSKYKDTNKIRLYKHYLDPANDSLPPPAYDRSLPDARIPKTSPSPPWIISTKRESAGGTKLTWVPSPGAELYIIKRAPHPTGPFGEIARARHTNKHTHEHTDAASAGTLAYYYKISALNAHGESEDSNVSQSPAGSD